MAFPARCCGAGWPNNCGWKERGRVRVCVMFFGDMYRLCLCVYAGWSLIVREWRCYGGYKDYVIGLIVDSWLYGVSRWVWNRRKIIKVFVIIIILELYGDVKVTIFTVIKNILIWNVKEFHSGYIHVRICFSLHSMLNLFHEYMQNFMRQFYAVLKNHVSFGSIVIFTFRIHTFIISHTHFIISRKI